MAVSEDSTLLLLLSSIWIIVPPVNEIKNSLLHFPRYSSDHFRIRLYPALSLWNLNRSCRIPSRYLALCCWSGDRPCSQLLHGWLDSSGNAHRLVCHSSRTILDVCYRILPERGTKFHRTVRIKTNSAGGRHIAVIQSLCKNEIAKYESLLCTFATIYKFFDRHTFKS